MTDGNSWFSQYARTGSESAFRELVARYVDLVYSTALRLVNNDTHLAEDVAQTVFVDLARKAATLPSDVSLGGWLHRHTCFLAGKMMRGDRRRQARERQAAEMNAQPDHSAANLAQIAPVLDEAINQLGAADRTAILLRFFEQRDFRAVGLALGSNEDTAQKRVSRALEKLHSLLVHRGVTLSATALGTALATQAVTAAPAGLAASISGTALASVAAGSGIALTVLNPVFKLVAMSKLKLGIIGAIVAASVAVPVLVHYQLNSVVAKEEVASESAQPEPAPQPDAVAAQDQTRREFETALNSPSPVAIPKKRSASPAVPTAPFNAASEIQKGQRLTATQAQELEAKLAQLPGDLSARCQLLGYYWNHKSPPDGVARQGHVQWFIQNHPELSLSPYANLNPVLDGATAYAQAKATWLQQAKDNSQNSGILGNAAQFCLLFDRSDAETLLKQAQALEPTNPAWSKQMAHLYGLDAQTAAHSGQPDSANAAASKALEQMEAAQANTTGDLEKLDNLKQLAKFAFDAGEIEKASTYAATLLQQASQQQSGRDDGDAVYRGNLVLGRIALRGGKLEDAKQYLLAAAGTTGSPVLGSFGPNMTLARDLLAQGEKETVLEYFQLCSKFWKSEKLAAWTAEVNHGLMPDFGANLIY